MEQKQLLVQAMAYLLCIIPGAKLGKLLNFCLAAKVEPKNSSKAPLGFAQELVEYSDTLSFWISEVIDSDDAFTVDEMVAISEMHLKDPQKFMSQLFEELESIDIESA